MRLGLILMVYLKTAAIPLSLLKITLIFNERGCDGGLEKTMNQKLIATHLTVIIRDDSPLIHCGDVSAYRRVTIELTEDQKNTLLVGANVYESISHCFLENIKS